MMNLCSNHQDIIKTMNQEISDSSPKLQRIFRHENFQISKFFSRKKLFPFELAIKCHQMSPF
ncbi:hypothetical protein Scep_001317 [Stephania cephalantha]|uniref:Uncharacterized protein n=1 Tax=Stephania cephalantha TaxID=152367 RepID=A0AAP0L854_9MAGN